MVLEQLGSEQVKIVLTAAELKKIGVSVRKRALGKREMSLVIKYILRRTDAFKTLGAFNRVRITFIKGKHGKLEIVLTRWRGLSFGGIGNPLIFKFYDIESLFTAAEEINRRHKLRVMSSDLYSGENGYYLVIHPLTVLPADFFILLSEFSSFLGRGKETLAKLSEHCKELERGRAIEKLCL